MIAQQTQTQCMVQHSRNQSPNKKTHGTNSVTHTILCHRCNQQTVKDLQQYNLYLTVIILYVYLFNC